MVSESGGGKVVVRTTGSELPEVELSFSSTREFEQVYARFLSHDGLYICTRQPLAASSVLRFRIKVSGDFLLAEGNAVVIWTVQPGAGKDLPPGMAVRFISLSGQSKEVIDQIVERFGQPFNLDRTLDEIETPPPAQPVMAPASTAGQAAGASEVPVSRPAGRARPALKLTVRGGDDQALPAAQANPPEAERPAPQPAAPKQVAQQSAKPAAQAPGARAAAARPAAQQPPAQRPRPQERPAAPATRSAPSPQPAPAAPKRVSRTPAEAPTAQVKPEPAAAPAAKPKPSAPAPKPPQQPVPAPVPRAEERAPQPEPSAAVAAPAQGESQPAPEPTEQSSFDFAVSSQEPALELEPAGGGELEFDLGSGDTAAPELEDEHAPRVVPSVEEDEHAPRVVPSVEEDEHAPSFVPTVGDDMFAVQDEGALSFEAAPEMAPAAVEQDQQDAEAFEPDLEERVEEDTLVFSEAQVAAVEMELDVSNGSEAAGSGLDDADTDTEIEVSWDEPQSVESTADAPGDALPQMEDVDVGEEADLAMEPQADAGFMDAGPREELPSVDLGDSGSWATPEEAVAATSGGGLTGPEAETRVQYEPPQEEPPASLFDDPALAEPSGSMFDEPASTEPSGSMFDEPVTAEPSGSMFEDPAQAEPAPSMFEEPEAPAPPRADFEGAGAADEPQVPPGPALGAAETAGSFSGPSPFLGSPAGETAPEPGGAAEPAPRATSVPSQTPASGLGAAEPAPASVSSRRSDPAPRTSSSARRESGSVSPDTTLGFDELSMPAKPKKERRMGLTLVVAATVFLAAVVGGFFAKDVLMGFLGMGGQASAGNEQPEVPGGTPEEPGGGQPDEPGNGQPAAVEPTPEPAAQTVQPTPKPQQPAPTAVPRPTQPRPTAPAQTAAAATAVLDISVRREGTATVVVISGNGSFSGDRFKALPMSDPPRVLVRLDNIVEGYPRTAVNADTPELSQIRIGHHPDKRPPQLFVVLDLAGPGISVTDSRATGSTITVRLSR